MGVWRSGTSLLYALLNQHPDIGLMYEGELQLLSSLFIGGRPRSDWADRWEFWNHALTRHHLDPRDFAGTRVGLRQTLGTVYRGYAALNRASIWGEKSPNYWDRMDRVLKLFPNARFIVIFRDPHAVCRSVIEAARQGSSYFARPGMALRALFACESLKRQADRLRTRDIPVHVLQYEDLVRSPETELRGICSFIGVPFDSRMVSLSTADRRGFYEGAHHSLAKGDRILADRSRDDLVPEQFKAKIDAYLNFWREKYSGEWPVYPGKLPAAPRLTVATRISDRLYFRFLRLVDDLTALVYCWAPMEFLRRHRHAKTRSSEESVAQRTHV